MAQKTVRIVHEEMGKEADVLPSTLKVHQRNGWKVKDEDSQGQEEKPEENGQVDGQQELPDDTDSTERDNGNSTTDSPIRGSDSKWSRR